MARVTLPIHVLAYAMAANGGSFHESPRCKGRMINCLFPSSLVPGRRLSVRVEGDGGFVLRMRSVADGPFVLWESGGDQPEWHRIRPSDYPRLARYVGVSP